MARFINQQIACIILDLLPRQIGCGDNQARPTVIDSRSILAGVQGFESLSPHSIALVFRIPSCYVMIIILNALQLRCEVRRSRLTK